MRQYTRHKDTVIAYLNGADVECFNSRTCKWELDANPSFSELHDFRIKKATVKHSGWVTIYKDTSGEWRASTEVREETGVGQRYLVENLDPSVPVSLVQVEWEE